MAVAKGRRVVLIVASIVVIGAGIKLAAPLLVPLLVAAFIAIVTAPLVMGLCDRGVPRLLAVLAGLLLDVAAGAALGFPLAAAIATFTERVPTYASMLSGQLAQVELWLADYGIHLESVYSFSEPSWMVNLATTTAQHAASFISQMVLVLLIVAFMLFESTGLREKLARIATPSQIQDLSQAAREVNAYLVAKTVMSLLTGILVFVWCWWRSVDVPLLWGLLAYLLNYIPTVGQIIAAVPA
ncbi:MAG: AI-2E family transporter, partial [Polyangiales bacterium]